MTASVEQVLAMLRGVEPRGEGAWLAICPAHSDVGASLSVTRGDRRAVVLHCFAGCSYEQIVTALAAGDARNGAAPPPTPPRPAPSAPQDTCSTGSVGGSASGGPNGSHAGAGRVTLDALAEHLHLPREFLESLGWRELRRGGVLVPYYSEDRAELYRKVRVKVAGKGDKYRHVRAKGAPRSPLAPFGLWRLADARAAGRAGLVLVEGETDAATLLYHGCPALGVPGATNAGTLTASHLVGFTRVFVVREPDRGGDAFLAGVSSRLHEVGFTGEVYEVALPDGAKDPAELHQRDPGAFAAAFREACERATPVGGPSVEAMFDTLAEVRGRPVEFLWRPYLVAREPNILMGAPGEGKGFAVAGIVAGVTRGEGLPGGLRTTEPGLVLLWSREDDPESVLKGRLALAGADLSRVKSFRFREHQFGFDPEALGVLAQALNRFRPALVVFDPIVSFMGGGVDLYRSNSVRDVLQPLADVIRRGQTTCLLVAHCRKGEVRRALDALFGSIDFAAIVRSGLGVYRDPHRPSSPEEGITRGTLAHAKHNLSLTGRSLRFEIHNTSTEEFGEAGAFRWTGEVDATADELASLTGGSTDERAGLADAVDLLQDLLGEPGAEIPATDIQRIAREKTGISLSTLYRAKRQLGIDDRRDGFGPGSRVVWFFLREGERRGDRQSAAADSAPGANRGPAPF